MTTKHWMQVVALASALGLAGAAVAQDHGRTSTDERGGVSSYGMDAPSSGAIVTPEDKAARMGRDDQDAHKSNDELNDDNAPNGDAAIAPNGDTAINPAPSSDDGQADTSPRYSAPATQGPMMIRNDASSPPRTGSDVQPGDMGPGSVRGQ